MSANTNLVIATEPDIQSLLSHVLEAGRCEVVQIGSWRPASEA